MLGESEIESRFPLWYFSIERSSHMPAEVFAGVIQLVQQAVGDGWAELTRRIPELAT
jgi:hypothetical protein